MTQYRTQGEIMEKSPERSAKARFGRWFVGWVLLPLSLLAGLFVFGMHWGARHPESQWISLTRWIAVHVFDEDPQIFSDSITAQKDGEAPEHAP